MTDSSINTLSDFGSLRSSPALDADQRNALKLELQTSMARFDWFTVGVMAPSSESALAALRDLEQSLGWDAMVIEEPVSEQGPVFLKANQSSGLIRIRIEHGLGEGLLISGHSHAPEQAGTTWGPLPLDFFR